MKQVGENKKILVCSAWPYASGVPHLGNLVSSLLSGDVFARYYRMRGHEVLYVSGTDAHGTRIEYEAKRLGISPEELAARNHERIQAVIDGFKIRFDNYTTTESPVHIKFVRDIYRQMDENGYISSAEEKRAYCPHCQTFLADRFITGTCPHCGAAGAMGNQCDSCGSVLEPEELLSPSCTLCGKSDIEFRPTRHWYIDLDRLAPELRAYVSSRDFQGNVQLFTMRMIEEGLRPRAMTRDIAWGIPAPFSGATGKVIYVWGEAALGYVSATTEYFQGGEEWKEFWFGDDVYQIYTIGKDNIPFHTLIFPGQLIAAGLGYHLPDQIAATEYLSWIGGESFSKSRGVGLYCDQALQVMDADLWRFYLLYNRPEGRDVNFSWEELEKAVNGVLISNVANLVNRVLSFVQSHHAGVVPPVDPDTELQAQLAEGIAAYTDAIEEGSLSRALRTVCSLAEFGNGYFQRKQPWQSGDQLAVAGAFHLIKAITLLLLPFTPGFASSVLDVIGISSPSWEDIGGIDKGRKINDGRVLLERIDREKIKQRMDDLQRETVSMDEFNRLDLRVGVIKSATDIQGADRLYRLTIDVGDRFLTSTAGIKGTYRAEELLGRRVVVLANLNPAKIKGITSQCMVLAAKGEQLSLLGPEHKVKPGTPIV
jgi:methionyl-tRNA synthetase